MLNLLWIGAVQTGFFLSKQDLLNRIFLMRVKQGKQDVNQQGRQDLSNATAEFIGHLFYSCLLYCTYLSTYPSLVYPTSESP